MSAKESAGFKLIVLLGVGLVLGAVVVLRKQLASSEPSPSGSSSVATPFSPSASVPTNPSVSTSADASPKPPTSADRAALLEAAAAGDLAKVQALHEKGVTLEGSLGPAARSGQLALVTWLVDHGVNVHEDEDAATPPVIEAEEHDAIVSILLARGAKEPTLIKAVQAQAPKTVARILSTKKGPQADANAKADDGESALHLAVSSGDGAKRTAIVKSLLDAGAKQEIALDAGGAGGATETALDMAINKVEANSDGAIDVVKLLVAKAPVDRDAMMIALSMRSERKNVVIDALLAGRVPPDVAYRGVGLATDPKLIQRIAAKGPIAWNTKDAYVEDPPLASAARRLDVDLVQALLTAGAPADGLDESGDSPLLAAIAAAPSDSEEATKIVNVLLAKGANVNRRAKDGRRPLHLAAGRGEEAVVKALLAKGARIDEEVNGTSPLEAAEDGGHQEIVKILLAKGAKKKGAPGTGATTPRKDGGD